MIPKKDLRSVLIAVFEQLQEQRSTLSSLLTEVAAVRDALIEIGPKYSDILDRHRARHRREAKPILDEALRKYDAIIEQLRRGL